MALVTLKMVEALPIIREAFNNKTLQLFTPSADQICMYSGPCAIGVCVPEELRATLDEGLACDSSIEILMEGVDAEEEGEEDIAPLVAVDESEREDFIALQAMHDEAVRFDDENSNHYQIVFDNFLRNLEVKYLGHQLDIV